MIELTKINLLPYREEIQQKQKQNFKSLMLLALLTGIGLSALAYFGINRAISSQEERNSYLSEEITKLDQNLLEINKLKKEKEEFLARKQKVEELQEKRFQAAQIIDTLNVLIPEGTYLTAITAENATTYNISGKATSDNKIAMFMRSIPSTGIFMQPELVNIKKVDNAQEFTLKVLLNQSYYTLPDASAPAVQSNNSTESGAEGK
ncbi:PilN domain-containing protein [Neisseria sp. Dent CA1/247]|uniref:PilN n=1 Tax=Neisseria zoodegmatis TaxID=326523 RepID=A0AB38DP58_9NEIS|nr:MULTISPECIES: PilN domain-containing protein [Neisseria]OSI10370.1 pilus assembly protein PilP [Neisseria zoodegmatis]UOO76758.1 PilN domain-containing protein [Neisseria sp. Dent CA1/247]SNU79064.1 PilN [Neisseria zoodegmatis]